jgi:hypothetical protein
MEKKAGSTGFRKGITGKIREEMRKITWGPELNTPTAVKSSGSL